MTTVNRLVSILIILLNFYFVPYTIITIKNVENSIDDIDDLEVLEGEKSKVPPLPPRTHPPQMVEGV